MGWRPLRTLFTTTSADCIWGRYGGRMWPRGCWPRRWRCFWCAAPSCRRRERLFAREDDRAAAAAMCAYALELAWCSGAVRRNVPLAQQRDELQSWAGDVLDAMSCWTSTTVPCTAAAA